MRIQPALQHASAMMASIIFTAIIGIVLSGYLMLVQHQNVANMRSLTWNSIIAVAEAGVEEALTHMNMNGTNIVANQGWESQGSYLMKRRALGDDQIETGYTAVLPPVIIAEGTKKFHFLDRDLSRTIVVRTQVRYLLSHGMVAKRNIDLQGSSIFVDSFDSSTEQFSTGGRYDRAKNKDNATIGTNSSVDNTMNAGNATILGTVLTGPGAQVAIGPNGAVGNRAWHAGGNKGIQQDPLAHKDDLNMTFKSVQAPETLWWSAPGGGTVDGVAYDYIFKESGDYEITTKTFSGKVLIEGEVRILVNTNVQFTGQDAIQIAPGGRLELYVAGKSATLGGSGVHNDSGLARNFIYYGLPTNQELTFSGNAEFIGGIYAPDTTLTIGGGGSDEYDFAGAAVVDLVKMNGKVNFHFDEDLMRRGPVRGLVAASWDEIPYSWEQIREQNLDIHELLTSYNLLH